VSRKSHRMVFGVGGKRSTVPFVWPVCILCGLLGLKNAATAAALRAPCPGKED
jgi:hypothetical protein